MQNNNNNNNNNFEILFWKVIKNKYLLNLIIHFLKSNFKYGRYSYDEISSTKWMIKNKHYSLLKEKIERGDMNLTIFNNQEDRDSLVLSSSNLFNIDDENLKNDKEFHLKIFKNYLNDIIIDLNNNSESTTSNDSNGNQEINQFSIRLIRFNNKIAFKLLIETFQFYKPTFQDFINSLMVKSFKISKYLFKKFKSLKKFKSFIWDSFKSSSIKSSDFDEILEFLIFKLGLELPKKKFIKSSSSLMYQTSLPYWIDYLIYDSTINQLLNSCYSILFLYPLDKLSNFEKLKKFYFKNNFGGYLATDKLIKQYLQEPFQASLTTTEYFEIKNKISSMINIKTTILKEIDYKNHNQGFQLFEMISKLIKMIIPFTSESRFIFNYLYYLIMYSNIFQIIDESDQAVLTTQQENIFNLLICWEERIIILEHCFKRKDIQILYLKYLISNYKKQLELGKVVSMDSILNYFLELLLSLNVSIELIEILKIEFDNYNVKPSKNNLISMVKSNEMFDFIFKSFYQNHGNDDPQKLYLNISQFVPNNIKYLKYLKLNYPKEYYEFIKINQKIPLGFLSNSEETIQFVYENQNDFIDSIKSIYQSSQFLSQFSRLLIISNRNQVIQDEGSNNNNSNYELINILNDPIKFKFFYKFLISNQNELLYLYYRNNCFIDLQSIFSKSSIFNLNSLNLTISGDFLFREIVTRVDLKSLDILLSIKPIERFLTPIFGYSFRFAKLSVFKFIFENYKWIYQDQKALQILKNFNTNHKLIYDFFKINLKINLKFNKFIPS